MNRSAGNDSSYLSHESLRSPYVEIVCGKDHRIILSAKINTEKPSGEDRSSLGAPQCLFVTTAHWPDSCSCSAVSVCMWGLRCYCGNQGCVVLGLKSGWETVLPLSLFKVYFSLFIFRTASLTILLCQFTFFLIFPWWQQCSICEFGNSAVIKKWFQVSPSHSCSCVLFVICRLHSL